MFIHCGYMYLSVSISHCDVMEKYLTVPLCVHVYNHACFLLVPSDYRWLSSWLVSNSQVIERSIVDGSWHLILNLFLLFILFLYASVWLCSQCMYIWFYVGHECNCGKKSIHGGYWEKTERPLQLVYILLVLCPPYSLPPSTNKLHTGLVEAKSHWLCNLIIIHCMTYPPTCAVWILLFWGVSSK